tara:strand:+ start:576 stop:1418 length:843 start_codon:yes stop_codon:yes gene_type:complete
LTIIPKVSIGLPVYNGAQTLSRTIDSLLNQSFKDFELIISDNHSSDETQEICLAYAARDSRIKYVRQPYTVAPEINYEYVLTHAQGDYFMWNADDDWRTPGFIEINFRELELNPNLVGSTSPDCWENDWPNPENLHSFSFEGNLYSSLTKFLRHCWVSGGVFYSLFRRRVLTNFNFELITIGGPVFACDWFLLPHVMEQGSIRRVPNQCTVLGLGGISQQADAVKRCQHMFIERFFPLYRFSKYFSGIVVSTNKLSLANKARLIIQLISLNIFIYRKVLR